MCLEITEFCNFSEKISVRILTVIFLLLLNSVFSQDGFSIKGNKKRIAIPFKTINNLIIVPVEVNGSQLNFLLDTGVGETLLFSLDESEQVKFENIEKVQFIGLGSKEPFEGFKSSGNQLILKDFVDPNHTIYIVLDQNINISSHIGTPVNGILGYHFFKNNLIEIDYSASKIYVYQSHEAITKKLKKKYTPFPITLEEQKPYVLAKVSEYSGNSYDAKLLIDTGNSDAVWLFQEQDKKITLPNPQFSDFLGKGFSGNVYGVRGRIREFSLGKFSFENPLISYPDSSSTQNLKLVENRVGSIGSELMKRFDVIYDYPNNKLYLKKNSDFDTPFNFNMSGINVQHEGLQWVKESTYNDNGSSSRISFDANGSKVERTLNYQFALKPIYSVLSVRKESPADLAGIREGDMILKINGSSTYNMSLEDIKEMLKSEDGKLITMELERKGVVFKVKFNLKSVI